MQHLDSDNRPGDLINPARSPAGIYRLAALGLAAVLAALPWLMLLATGPAAAEPPTLVAAPATDAPSIDIGQLVHMQLAAPVEFLLADRDSNLAEVRRSHAFLPLDASHMDRGISSQVYWLRLRLSNTDSATDRHWILHHDTSYLDRMTVYYAGQDGVFHQRRLTDRVPFGQRDIDFRKLAFSHVTPAGGYTDLYLRLSYAKPDSLTLRLHLWDAGTFQQMRAGANLLYGGYYGMMLAFLCIAVVCALVLRRIVYLEYAVFLLFNGLVWAALNGFGFQYLWPDLPVLHNEGTHILFLLMALAAFQFSKRLLTTGILFPRLHRVISVIQAGMVLAIALRLSGSYLPVLVLAYIAIFLLCLLPILGWLAYRRGVRHARWYTAAWVVYSASLLCSVASATGWLPGWGRESLIYTQLASLFEALLLLVALGDRLLGWDRERRTALALAHRDPLTGLGNRRRLIQAFAEQGVRAAAEEPMFVAMIDLDRFKEINDTHGHDAGDLVLQDLARLLLRHTRSDDVCVRYGGEEFAVLFRAPSLADAHHVVERIRLEFAANPTRHAEHAIEHTFSAGLVQLDESGSELGLEEMVARADAALYSAKADGRNKTLLASANTLPTGIA